MKKFVIIVAGGSGLRMGTELPKQFLELCGKPVLMHSLQVFYDFDPLSELILVLPSMQQEFWATLCIKHSFTLPHKIATGGETRFHSVQNGLKLVNEPGIVMIHDGVRPLVSAETLTRCCLMAEKSGNAIPVLPVTESLRKLEGTENMAVDRRLYYSVQTPQTFLSAQILEAFQQPWEPVFTDDASVAEKRGFKINMVEGNTTNIKITTPSDLAIAELFLKTKGNSVL
ncbi:MAG TPA: 2-C-methyl-D-erythritol 4-phosphate cytidylyltransferase [Prolixibacteraceae bacterium]|nr:2-C-methyl-D-erythritol 4-phosphate cytidylyltransferase [Prolixibacteraceae bacterium]